MSRILIVDDNETLGSGVVLMVERMGHEGVAVTSGPEGLARLVEQAFDLVITDYRMDDMDGQEVLEAVKARAEALLALAQELRRRAPQVPVVLTSGYSHVLAQSDAHDFTLLHKPYSAEQLSRILHQALGLGRTAGASADPS